MHCLKGCDKIPSKNLHLKLIWRFYFPEILHRKEGLNSVHPAIAVGHTQFVYSEYSLECDVGKARCRSYANLKNYLCSKSKRQCYRTGATMAFFSVVWNCSCFRIDVRASNNQLEKQIKSGMGCVNVEGGSLALLISRPHIIGEENHYLWFFYKFCQISTLHHLTILTTWLFYIVTWLPGLTTMANSWIFILDSSMIHGSSCLESFHDLGKISMIHGCFMDGNPWFME